MLPTTMKIFIPTIGLSVYMVIRCEYFLIEQKWRDPITRVVVSGGIFILIGPLPDY